MRRLAPLEHLAVPGREGRGGGGLLDEAAVAHPALGPACAAADELADRQRVQELVGEQDRRKLRQRVHAVVPGDRRASSLQAFRLQAAQPRRGLDQVELQRRARSRARRSRMARSASAISVPRPGPQFGERHRGGAAHRLPGHGGPGAEQLAEHLGDLRRGGEVPERVVRRVIRRVGARHEGVEALHAASPQRRPAAAHSPRLRQGEVARLGPDDQAEPGQDHRHAQQLAHRHPGPEEAQERVRLAEQLADDAGEP